jgi:hypothetical protein
MKERTTMTRNSVPLVGPRAAAFKQPVLSRIARGGLLGSVATTALLAGSGCLDRPVAPASPRTSNTVTGEVRQTKVDKIDLLFMIDNSASMADKQAVLAKAVPDLVRRLANPVCISKAGEVLATQPNFGEACPPDSAREFDPIKDIHIGVVTSSLGGHGADICELNTGIAVSQQNNVTRNDRAHLINRFPRGADSMDYSFSQTVATYKEYGFLAWDPDQKKNDPREGVNGTPMSGTSPGEGNVDTLVKNFADIVQGADQVGCGYESSLEGWYRFLIEPNPPASVHPQTNEAGEPQPTLPMIVEGRDDTLLQQRADFLRPDSLVAIIALSDENDCSIIDGQIPQTVCNTPLYDKFGESKCDPATKAGCCDPFDAGQAKECDVTKPPKGCKEASGAWPEDYGVDANFAGFGDGFPVNSLVAQGNVNGVPWHLYGGTEACADNPYSPDCQPCLRVLTANPNDPRCAPAPLSDTDSPQLRCWNHKQRFGWDALYPIKRYVEGLISDKVLSFADGYDQKGNGFDGGGRRMALRVPNPLFDDLPFNNARAAGKALARPKFPVRPKTNVFFAGIVGVPWQDIAKDSKDLRKGYKTATASEDGSPGIDWNMILGDPYNRKKIVPPTDPLMVETNQIRSGQHPITGEAVGQSGWNTINGHEWNAGNTDLQYACIFPLPPNIQRDCKTATGGCDCGENDINAQQNPLCNPPVDAANPAVGDPTKVTTVQTRAKAYPGTRFLQVLHDIQTQAVVASICSPNVTNEAEADFGYRPAVAAIVDRLKSQLSGRCLPRSLAANPDGTTPCVIIDARYPKDAPVSKEEIANCKKCNFDKDTLKAHRPLAAEIAANLSGDVTQYQCLCEVVQFNDDPKEGDKDLTECQTTTDLDHMTSGHGGWCYVDPSQVSDALKPSMDEIVKKCPANERRKLRFVPAEIENTSLFFTCLGAASGTDSESGAGGGTGAAGTSGTAAGAAGAP